MEYEYFGDCVFIACFTATTNMRQQNTKMTETRSIMRSISSTDTVDKPILAASNFVQSTNICGIIKWPGQMADAVCVYVLVLACLCNNSFASNAFGLFYDVHDALSLWKECVEY